jgi:hypothetical protein
MHDVVTTAHCADCCRVLQVDAGNCVLRGKLGEMLNCVLGRQAHKTELAAWFSVSIVQAAAAAPSAQHAEASKNFCDSNCHHICDLHPMFMQSSCTSMTTTGRKSFQQGVPIQQGLCDD